ncbi:hypothetical protein MKZ38_003908 [Zalerion maritima]|uniref:Uncharacterized protein n=1 Tax=Zalerion maritima TaxID=339359 RepID=A0AAD5RNI2_9PEZI|nr:hypothetical protein MKZ38_003908 [Zalerion maritima]
MRAAWYRGNPRLIPGPQHPTSRSATIPVVLLLSSTYPLFNSALKPLSSETSTVRARWGGGLRDKNGDSTQAHRRINGTGNIVGINLRVEQSWHAHWPEVIAADLEGCRTSGTGRRRAWFEQWFLSRLHFVSFCLGPRSIESSVLTGTDDRVIPIPMLFWTTKGSDCRLCPRTSGRVLPRGLPTCVHPSLWGLELEEYSIAFSVYSVEFPDGDGRGGAASEVQASEGEMVELMWRSLIMVEAKAAGLELQRGPKALAEVIFLFGNASGWRVAWLCRSRVLWKFFGAVPVSCHAHASDAKKGPPALAADIHNLPEQRSGAPLAHQLPEYRAHKPSFVIFGKGIRIAGLPMYGDGITIDSMGQSSDDLQDIVAAYTDNLYFEVNWPGRARSIGRTLRDIATEIAPQSSPNGLGALVYLRSHYARRAGIVSAAAGARITRWMPYLDAGMESLREKLSRILTKPLCYMCSDHYDGDSFTCPCCFCAICNDCRKRHRSQVRAHENGKCLHDLLP